MYILTRGQSIGKQFTPVVTVLVLVLVYTQEGSLWNIVLRCDDHTGIFTCDGCARDPYFYVTAETQSYVINFLAQEKSLPLAGIELGTLAGVTMTLFCTHGYVSGPSSLLDPEVIAPCGNGVPCQLCSVVWRHGRGVLWAGGDPRMTESLKCWLARPVLAHRESDRYRWSPVLDNSTPERP